MDDMVSHARGGAQVGGGHACGPAWISCDLTEGFARVVNGDYMVWWL